MTTGEAHRSPCRNDSVEKKEYTPPACGLRPRAATDGQVSGGGDVDKFCIKIWPNSGGSAIYHNQPCDPDTADASTALGGGSIVVHRP